MNEFEKTSNDTMSEYSDARDMRENVIYWLNGDKECTVNFTQVKYISKVKRMAEKYPDRVKIISEKNGVLIATIPVKAVKVSIITRPVNGDVDTEDDDSLCEELPFLGQD